MHKLKYFVISFVALSSASVANVTVASAKAPYNTEWRPVSGSPIEIKYKIEKGNWVGNSPQQAAEMGADRCQPDLDRLKAQGYLVLAFRGTATPTASPYIFSGNCDAQVIRPIKDISSEEIGEE